MLESNPTNEPVHLTIEGVKRQRRVGVVGLHHPLVVVGIYPRLGIRIQAQDISRPLITAIAYDANVVV